MLCRKGNKIVAKKRGSGIFHNTRETGARSSVSIPVDHRPRTCADCTMTEYCPKGKKRSRRKMNPSSDLCRVAAKNLKKAVAATGVSC